MSDIKHWDIHEVCDLLHITSRTLRFYEDKGVIQSNRDAFSSRRRYTLEQIAHIRHVITLRTLGLSLKAIQDLIQHERDLRETIVSRRAEMLAIIEEKQREIRILNEALCMIDEGENIFEQAPEKSVDHIDEELEKIVKKCSEGLVENHDTIPYSLFSEKLKEYMPKTVYTSCRQDTLSPLGNFVAYDRMERDSKYPNIVYHYIKYEKLGLKLQYVFHRRQIQGFWMGYYIP